MPDESNSNHRKPGKQDVAAADREFAARVQAAEDARREARLKLSPEAAERVRQQRAAGIGPATPGTGPRMLPGMAMIALFVLVYALMNVVAAWRGMFGDGVTRYGTLAICTMLVVGVFGFLRLRRWGWALVLGGTLFTALSYVLRFITAHVPLSQGLGMLVWAAFFTVFFLYLVRDEVRSSVR
ncbi:hypothetical protein [Terriglobus aquaticus]|uniref:Uncharacterized protein n=1 Tax=Terriglobus aquaticus TaxID=940139 RepID=A0ABW9KJ82_9BACT|nr:hypothetical protein [Terriglobus aquaticus]